MHLQPTAVFITSSLSKAYFSSSMNRDDEHNPPPFSARGTTLLKTQPPGNASGRLVQSLQFGLWRHNFIFVFFGSSLLWLARAGSKKTFLVCRGDLGALGPQKCTEYMITGEYVRVNTCSTNYFLVIVWGLVCVLSCQGALSFMLY